MESSKDHFCNLRVENIFMNIFAKTKIFSKIFKDITLRDRYYRFMQKNREKKISCYCPFNNTVARDLMSWFLKGNKSTPSPNSFDKKVPIFPTIPRDHCTFFLIQRRNIVAVLRINVHNSEIPCAEKYEFSRISCIPKVWFDERKLFQQISCYCSFKQQDTVANKKATAYCRYRTYLHNVHIKNDKQEWLSDILG